MLRLAIEAAATSGDVTYAAYSRRSLVANLLTSGEPLAEVERELDQALAFSRAARLGLSTDSFESTRYLIRGLRGEADEEELSEDPKFTRRLTEGGARLAVVAARYWLHLMQARFFADDPKGVLTAAAKASVLLWSVRPYLETVEYHFYRALAQAAAFESMPGEQRPAVLAEIEAHRRQIAKWAKGCPENHAHRVTLIAAEIARLEGRPSDAEHLYEEAVHLARTHGFVQNEGIANELAARFHSGRGLDTISDAYLRNARVCYSRWGALAKVQRLDRHHPQLAALSTATAATISSPLAQLDVATVVKASQALSQEIRLDDLIETLIRIVLQHAAAERGSLILFRDGESRIEAEATIGHSGTEVNLRPGANATALPESVLNYVIRTRESVLLDDATAANPFSADEYLRLKRPRSILCLPILKQAKLVGALYLEHDQAPHVFTVDRVAVLELLASQAAISLENARLYAELMEENSERKRAEDKVRASERQAQKLVELRSAVGTALSMTAPTQDILNASAEAIVRYFDAGVADIWTMNKDANILKLQASAGDYACFERANSRVEVGKSNVGLIAQEGIPHITNDVSNDPRIDDHEWALACGFESFAAYPLSIEGRVVGVIAMFASHPLSQAALDTLASVTDTIAQGIERKRAEQALRASERELRMAIESIPSLVWTTLPDGSNETFSKQWHEFTGITPEAARNGGWHASFHPDDFIQVAAKWTEMLTLGIAGGVEARLRSADGEYRLFLVRGVPLRDESGTIIKWYGTSTDMEDLRRSEDRLKKTQDELAHVTRVTTMGELAASIAHEVSQPIAGVVINGTACLRWLAGLENSTNLSEAKEAVQRIVRDGKRAGDVISRIRTLFKKAETAKELLNLNEAIEEVVIITRSEMEKRRVMLRLELSEELPSVVGDRVQLQQVMLNLFLNAVEAMSTVNDRPRELIVSTQVSEQFTVLVRVRDTGPGLDPESMEKIFIAFHTTKSGGLGMGLSISRSIVENHSGRLWCTANDGPGATFQFTLLAEVAQAEDSLLAK